MAPGGGPYPPGSAGVQRPLQILCCTVPRLTRFRRYPMTDTRIADELA